MRNLSADALLKIANNVGNEPITIIEVEWVKDSDNKVSYADRDLTGILGRILDVSTLDNVINISNNADSQEITVILDDTDGSIRAIMDVNDVHFRDVWVYQWFEGLSLSDKFLLFKGKINSPVTWNEGDRTVEFTVITQLEDREIGFSPEEGDFEDITPDLIGKPWPMCFGTVQHVKALRLTESRSGILGDGVGIADFALRARSWALASIATYQSGTYCRVSGWGVDGLCSLINQSTWTTDRGIVRQSNAALATFNCQKKTERNSFRVFNHEVFPRGTINLKIDNATLVGHFVGSTNQFVLHKIGEQYQENHPEWDNFGIQAIDAVAKGLYGGRSVSGQTPQVNPECPGGTSYVDVNPGLGAFGGAFKYQCGGDCASRHKIMPHAEGSTPFQIINLRSVSDTPGHNNGRVVGDNAGYVYLRPGARVELAGAESQKFVVSIVPGTVKQVTAWAQKEGQRFLQTVPTNYYTVTTETFGQISAVIVTLDEALSKYTDMGWEDDIYVTFESSVGPNVVDIMEYLIGLYTDFSVDATSFAYVKNRVTNYPAHFAIYDRRNILTVLQEIAYQACCSIYLKNDVFFITYLPEQPDAVSTLTRGDMEVKSLGIGHTATEDVITKMVCKWKKSDAQDKPFRTILRHNITKYGTLEDDFDYYIYNYVDAVVKSATFWMIRRANTWKKVRFKTPLTKLNLESLDPIDINLVGDLANVAVRSIIEKADYDSADHSLLFECWTPVKAGTMVPYYFAYPADVDQIATFPTDSEIQEGFSGSGFAPNQSATGRLIDDGQLAVGGGLGLAGVTFPEDNEDPYNEKKEDPETGEEEDRRDNDRGNPTPSDIGDGLPQIVYPEEETLGESEPGPESPDYKGEHLVDPDGWGNAYVGGPGSNLQDSNVSNPDGSSKFDPNDLPTPDELPPNDCYFCVSVSYLDPVAHVIPSGCDGYPYEGGWDTGCGCPINGTFHPNAELYIFDSCSAALAMADSINNNREGCVGGKAMYGAVAARFNGGVCAGAVTEETCAADDCQEPADPEMIGFSPYSGGSEWESFSERAGETNSYDGSPKA